MYIYIYPNITNESRHTMDQRLVDSFGILPVMHGIKLHETRPQR